MNHSRSNPSFPTLHAPRSTFRSLLTLLAALLGWASATPSLTVKSTVLMEAENFFATGNFDGCPGPMRVEVVGDSTGDLMVSGQSYMIGIARADAPVQINWAIPCLDPLHPVVQGNVTLPVPQQLQLLTDPKYAGVGETAYWQFPAGGMNVKITLDWGDGSAPESWLGTSYWGNHAYATPGVHTFTTVASNGTKYTAPARSHTVTVLKATARLLTPTAAANTDVKVEFTDLVPGHSYTVFWGDGQQEVFTTAAGTPGVTTRTHQYVKDGTYNISTNLGYLPTFPVTIQSPPPTLSVMGTGLTATLSVKGMQPDTTYVVDWGDGSSSTATLNQINQDFTHAYATAGPKTINLIRPTPTNPTAVINSTTFNAGLGPVTLRVTPANTPDHPLTGEQVTVDMSGLEPSATYLLDWGDGAVDPGITNKTTASSTHAYNRAQDFTVNVTSSGRTLGSATVSVQVPAPVLVPSVQGLSLSLGVQNLVPTAVYTVTWGDGKSEPLNATAPSVTLTHTYSAPGPQTVTVTPARGAATSVPVTLVASQAKLTVVPASAYTEDTLSATMTDLVKGLLYTLNWGDGSPAVPFTAADVQATQTHTYATPGTYNVDLSAPNVNPVSTPVTVKPGAPVLNLTSNVLTATLNASKLFNGVSYTVDWGAGVTERFVASGPSQTFTHSYAAPGPQTVTVTPDAGKPATATITLTVPGPTLSVTPAQGQTDSSFTATLGGLVPALTYTLNWGDGSSEPVTGVSTFTRAHSYAAPGSFTVSVTSAGVAPAQQTVTVRVPTPILSSNNVNLALTLQLSGLVKAAVYRVDWGDGQTENLTATAPAATLPHTYAAAGTYTITITPLLGDSAKLPVNVQIVSVPAPVLNVAPVSTNVYSEVKADFGGLTAALTYTLDWGDGVRETITGVTGGQRTHTYPRAGTYPVSLKAPESPAAIVSVTITQPVPVLTATSVLLVAEAKLSGLIPALTYRLDWGDGTPPVDITGVDAKTLGHTYARPGPYTLTLTVAGGPPVTASLSVIVPAASLNVNSVELNASATLAGLQSSLTYTLNWGDGSSSTVSGKTADSLTHAYAKPGVYTLILSTPGTADVSATVNIVVKPLTLLVVAPELRATATLTGLVRALTYTVTWGDGTQETVTGQEGVTLSHPYAKPGQYTVTVTAPGLEPVSTTFTAGLPPQEVITTKPGLTPDVQDIRITGLIAGGPYLLDYGDGQTEPLSFTGQTGSWTHRYLKSGIYTLTLTLRTPDGLSSVRAVATVQVQQSMTIGAANLTFSKNPISSALTVTTLNPIGLQLSVPYSGSGTLTGNWVIDGQAGPSVTLDLPEGGTSASADYSVSPPQPGRHTLAFQITGVTPRCLAACPPPTLPAVNSLSYTLDVPSTLTYGGLNVTLTDVTNLDLQAFSAGGTVRLIVAGVDLGPQPVTLKGVKVTRTASDYSVTGGVTTVNLDSLALRALGLGQTDVRLQTLTLTPQGAALSGSVTLPGAGAALTFQDAPLKDGGLMTELGGARLSNVQIGSSGISFSAPGGVLDLSSTENPSALNAAYVRASAPGPDWMGLVLPGATLTIGTALLPIPAEVSAPVAYTLGGYTSAFELPAGNLNFVGWTVKTSGLKAAVSASSLSSFAGKGSLTIPMVNETLPLDISWNPQLGKPGAKWEMKGTATPPTHDFGRTKLEFSFPTLETRGDGSVKLTFANAKWNLGGVSGAEVKIPLYNLSFTSDGDVNLGGNYWASATGLTNFTLFDYPFPTAEVGVGRRADGEYTLSLRGKIQLGQVLPLNAIAQPIHFWVKDGKDEKIVFEKLQLKGVIKTVEFDVALSAMFQDEKTLEFIGEGYLKIAKRIRVAAKAGFGMDHGTSYGFLWAAVRSPTLKPFVTAGDVGFYEFHGGVGINMVWKDGNFEVPPVKAIPPASAARVVNVAVQGGAVFGTAFDNGTTAHFRGTLGVDSEGTVAIKAVAWLFTPLELGAFSTYSTRVNSGAGQHMETVSTQGALAPNGAALVVISVPPDSPDSGYVLVQACVGPAEKSAVGGLDCTRNRELTFFDIVTLRGYAEIYLPFSGSGQHVYLGTKANPIGVRLLSLGSSTTTKTTTNSVKNADGTVTPSKTTSDIYGSGSNTPDAGSSNKTTSKANGIEGNGYLMLDSTTTRIGLGVDLNYSIGQSGSGKICDWYWYANAHVGLNADFIVAYNPVSLDAQLTLSAGASAGVGACGIPLDVGINVSLTGRMYISAQSRFFEGTASGTVSMPVIPDIPFSVSARAEF